ncbi:MAG: TIGR04283 family arsenosugar biosynthesis glycosyltransferase [Burkholderiaceae bacterium]
MSTFELAVVVPTLNEAAGIGRLLAQCEVAGVRCFVVDGGSDDDTVRIARATGADVSIAACRGRAAQMREGADRALAAGAQALLFVHADVVLPGDWLGQVRRCARSWGRFDVRLDAVSETGTRPLARSQRVLLSVVGAAMNLRSRMSGICTGDQGLFVAACAYRDSGGFPSQPLMEDLEISRRLKRSAGWPSRLPGPLQVSARRWLRDGVLRTILRMWWVRLRYFFGVSAERLAREYYPPRTNTGSR